MSLPRVVIIGSGFGGLFAARELENKPVEVVLIDRQNYHTFTPLLYQVATCGLEAEEIAYPIRGIFRGGRNMNFLMGEVTGIDPDAKTVAVLTEGGPRIERYDYLIVAAGSVTNFFGNDAVRQHAHELKTLADATGLRSHILRKFEQASWTDDPAEREALTTIVVVGGGPSGLETVGAVQELVTNVLTREYAFLRQHKARVILVEALDHLLTAFPRGLQRSALKQVQSLGIEVRLRTTVTGAEAGAVMLKDERGTFALPAHTLIWLAGVKGAGIGGVFREALAKGDRVITRETTEVEGCEGVYVVGDLSSLTGATGRPYAQLIPPAKQQGILAARNILAHMAGKPQAAFRYNDRGIMATIGRRRAVAYIYNRIPLTGGLAWFAWLALHLVTLMGFRNRINVLINWVWNYFTFDRSVRIILNSTPRGVRPASVVTPAVVRPAEAQPVSAAGD